MDKKIKEVGLYIHIPFCKSKCYYCDFFSLSGKEIFEERYIQSIEKEMLHYALENKILYEHGIEEQYVIKTIYIGRRHPFNIRRNIYS